MNRSEILAALQQEYADRRGAHRLQEQRRRDEAEAAIPGLKDALAGREALIFNGIKGILRGNAAAEDLPARMDALNRQVTGLLTGAGYPADWLDPVCTCMKCRDTGYVGQPIREMCSCLRAALNERLYSDVGLKDSGQECFELFDENVFPDQTIDGLGVSQRRLMMMIRNRCQQWADSYPDTHDRDLVLSGKGGLGKTWMLHAMAKRLLDRGHEVLIVSAYRFFELAKKARFSREDKADAGFQTLIDAPVLMIDDLGTEPMMENLTIVELFNLLNERQLNGRSTVISTNLNEKELQGRYTERVTSRLLDKRSCAFIPFAGDDLRRL